MNILVTAGNTQAPIDRVRCLTNIFTGRTGAALALEGYRRGHGVHLLTSHPEVIDTFHAGKPSPPRWRCTPYRTFDELHELLAREVQSGGHDAVIHCAAVSDYVLGGVYAPAEGTRFDTEERRWVGTTPQFVDRAAGKVKSDEPELWLRLVRAPKLVDLMRVAWGFHGVLVKFKLEVGVSEEQLLTVAEKSRRHSGADLMVANTLEGAGEWAYVGPLNTAYRKVSRAELPVTVIAAVEAVRAGGK